MQTYFDKQSSKDHILVKGARVHNLKNIDVAIPRNKLVVITGLSGSGKSSLAFDTLYAEGQRRYVESLSSYARQFLGRMNKPEVDYIHGITPAIAIEQKVTTRSPRSTVGTATEIYDYLKLLFARIGKTYSPISGHQVKRHSVTHIVDFILDLKENSKVVILSPIFIKTGRSIEQELTILLQQGFSRVSYKNEITRIDELLESKKTLIAEDLFILISRVVVKADNQELASQLADSIQTAFYEGNGNCNIEVINDNGTHKFEFSDRFELDGMKFEDPTPDFFSFNNPYGACKTCEGFGSVIGIDKDLVIPDKTLSVYQEAIACWKGEKMGEYREQLIMNAAKFDFPIHKPYFQLSEEQKELLWIGNKWFTGINGFFKEVEANSYKIQYRVMLARYRGKTECPECRGTRLRGDASYVKVDNMSILDMVLMPIGKLLKTFENLNLNAHDRQIASRLITEISNRLLYMADVGLEYLTLNRAASTLSGGESQRMNLARSLGSSLVGSTYILDEPSIGLHPRDTLKLLDVLKKLRNDGNTVIVVEHEEEIIRNADYIIDIGPLAGVHGGELVFQGSFNELANNSESLTAKYINKELSIPVPSIRRKWKDYIMVQGAHENNLKNIDVKFPLQALTVITGVSGSGKTSLVKHILYAGLKRQLSGYSEKTGKHRSITGDIQRIADIEFVDQNPIGRSSRSNPVTYVKAFDEIRDLYAQQPMSQLRGYKPGYFSFNVAGGRCDECEGEGMVTIEMQFMADIHLVCESCKGARYKEEVLDVLYKEKNIADILKMTVTEAIEFFEPTDKKFQNLCKKITDKLKPLEDVGLGYVQLGQASSTLSGGEAQRIKLASFLGKGQSSQHVLFIFDEPTTGLHFHDINKLLVSFNALIEQGHSIVVIEHNPEIIKSSDWVIDLGPEGGDGGGSIVFEGTPDDLINCEDSYTGRYLKEVTRGG